MVLVCSYARHEKRSCPPSADNEYFRNAAEGQNKAAEWVGYFFPTPLVEYCSLYLDFLIDLK